jgi:hypothetical protein
LIDVYNGIATQSKTKNNDESNERSGSRGSGCDVPSSNLSHLLHGTRDGVANVVLL